LFQGNLFQILRRKPCAENIPGVMLTQFIHLNWIIVLLRLFKEQKQLIKETAFCKTKSLIIIIIIIIIIVIIIINIIIMIIIIIIVIIIIITSR